MICVACCGSYAGAIGGKAGATSSHLGCADCDASQKGDIHRLAGFTAGGFLELPIRKLAISLSLVYEQRGWREDMILTYFEPDPPYGLITETEDRYLTMRLHYLSFPLLLRIPVWKKRSSLSVLAGPSFSFLAGHEQAKKPTGAAVEGCTYGDGSLTGGIVGMNGGLRIALPPIQGAILFFDLQANIDVAPRAVGGEGASGRSNTLSACFGMAVPAFESEVERGGAPVKP